MIAQFKNNTNKSKTLKVNGGCRVVCFGYVGSGIGRGFGGGNGGDGGIGSSGCCFYCCFCCWLWFIYWFL